MVLFEIAVILGVLIITVLLSQTNKKIHRRVILIFVAVLLFEYFTQAMWINNNLERWSYLYLDVNWVITIGWVGLILMSTSAVNILFKKSSERARFIYSLIALAIVGVVAEGVVRYLGIREYAEAVKEGFLGVYLFGTVPIEALYYIPVFMALVISFVRYWEICLDQNTGGKKKR